MTKENQKILYEHFTSIANNKKKDKGNKDFKPIIRENAKRYAEEIDESFDFSGKKARAIEAEKKKEEARIKAENKSKGPQ